MWKNFYSNYASLVEVVVPFYPPEHLLGIVSGSFFVLLIKSLMALKSGCLFFFFPNFSILLSPEVTSG